MTDKNPKPAGDDPEGTEGTEQADRREKMPEVRTGTRDPRQRNRPNMRINDSRDLSVFRRSIESTDPRTDLRAVAHYSWRQVARALHVEAGGHE